MAQNQSNVDVTQDIRQLAIKKIVEDIKKTVQQYGEITYRTKSVSYLHNKKYYNRVSIGELLNGTELKDIRRLRIDYIKTSDTVVLVISKPHQTQI